jgi:hypothetical protein|nr:MAG TPA: hypothetical protein [Caudoviricetes sp.]
MITNPGILFPFGKEPDYAAAREYRSEYLAEMLNTCSYFKPFDLEIDLSKIARGGILHRIRNNPGVNIYIPGYCNVLIGYFPGSVFQIPFPYLLLSERNRDLRMLIFSEAAGLVQFLQDIRNDQLKFDNYMADGLSKGYFLSIRLQHSNVDNCFVPQHGYNIPFVTGYKIPPHSQITDELFNSRLYGQYNWPDVSDIDYNSHFGIYSKTKSEIIYTPKELILMEDLILNRCAERIANNET